MRHTGVKGTGGQLAGILQRQVRGERQVITDKDQQRGEAKREPVNPAE